MGESEGKEEVGVGVGGSSEEWRSRVESGWGGGVPVDEWRGSKARCRLYLTVWCVREGVLLVSCIISSPPF